MTMTTPPRPTSPTDSDRVPSSKRFHFSTRENSEYKWQRTRGVVGALEVKSEPVFKCRDDLLPRYNLGREEVFQDALQAWEDFKLRDGFIEACDSLPIEMCCCGMLQDADGTIKECVPILNENWVKAANRKLLERGMKIDMFLWNWQNASGKAETNILLIRFFELSSYRLQRATQDGSIDFDLLVEEEQAGIEEEEGPDAPAKKQEMARS